MEVHLDGSICGMRSLATATAVACVCLLTVGWPADAWAQAITPPGTPFDRLQAEIDALQQQVNSLSAQLARPQQVLNLSVDCFKGQTVSGALAQATTHAGPVVITISGVCQEAVFVNRDDVTLRGASAGDGIQAPAQNVSAIVVRGMRTSLQSLTIGGGLDGVQVGLGSLEAQNVIVSGASQFGIEIDAAAGITGSTIDGNETGIGVGQGGSALVNMTDVSNNHFMGVTVMGGRLEMHGGSVNGNAVEGLQSWLGGALFLRGVSVQHNTFAGVDLNSNSSAWLAQDQGQDTVISANGGSGVAVNSGSALELQGATLTANNGGIQASGGSTIRFGNGTLVTVASNQNNGVFLQDTSVVQTTDPTLVRITQNTGWGVLCQGPPAVSQISPFGPFTLGSSAVFGNAQGQIGCPGGGSN